jgi:hypothetical protein
MDKSTFFHSRAFKLTLSWTLFGCAILGTALLSRSINLRSLNMASVGLISGRVHEVWLYSDRAEPQSIGAWVGDQIDFIVKDKSTHNMAEERSRKSDARLESGEFRQGESYSLIFSTPGEFSLYDRMNQDIHVSIMIK